MALIVQSMAAHRFGDIARIRAVVERIIRARDQGDRVVVVVSAMSGETDRLMALATQITERPQGRELDVLLSTGEQVTIALLCMALTVQGCSARSLHRRAGAYPHR